jgi:hypothetical protein
MPATPKSLRLITLLSAAAAVALATVGSTPAAAQGIHYGVGASRGVGSVLPRQGARIPGPASVREAWVEGSWGMLTIRRAAVREGQKTTPGQSASDYALLYGARTGGELGTLSLGAGPAVIRQVRRGEQTGTHLEYSSGRSEGLGWGVPSYSESRAVPDYRWITETSTGLAVRAEAAAAMRGVGLSASAFGDFSTQGAVLGVTAGVRIGRLR